MIIQNQNDYLRSAKEIWREAMAILGKDPEKFPKACPWVNISAKKDSNDPVMQWDTGLVAIFKQGTGMIHFIPVIWKMSTFFNWYLPDDQKPFRLWLSMEGSLLRIFGDPKRIEGGLEFIGVVSPRQKNKAEEEEPRWKQRHRSDFPAKK